MSNRDLVPQTEDAAEVAEAAPELSREYTFSSEEDISDEYTPEEIAKIIAKANVALLRLRSIDYSSVYHHRRFQYKIIKYSIVLSFVALVSAIFNSSIIDYVLPRFFGTDEKYLILRITYILFLLAVGIILGLDIYRLYKTQTQTVYVEQANLFKNRLEELLFRLEKKNANSTG